MRNLMLFMLCVGLSGCVGSAVNQATIYRAVSGVIQVDVKVPAGETVSSVQFQVNEAVIGEDNDGADGFSADLDTSALPADTLAKVAAVGIRPDGSQVVLRENYVLIEAEATEEGVTPLPGKGNAAENNAAAAAVTPTATDTAAYKQTGMVPVAVTNVRKRKTTIIHLN